jgi:hypothetical protein
VRSRVAGEGPALPAARALRSRRSGLTERNFACAGRAAAPFPPPPPPRCGRRRGRSGMPIGSIGLRHPEEPPLRAMTAKAQFRIGQPDQSGGRPAAMHRQPRGSWSACSPHGRFPCSLPRPRTGRVHHFWIRPATPRRRLSAACEVVPAASSAGGRPRSRRPQAAARSRKHSICRVLAIEYFVDEGFRAIFNEMAPGCTKAATGPARIVTHIREPRRARALRRSARLPGLVVPRVRWRI